MKKMLIAVVACLLVTTTASAGPLKKLARAINEARPGLLIPKRQPKVETYTVPTEQTIASAPGGELTLGSSPKTFTLQYEYPLNWGVIPAGGCVNGRCPNAR